MTEQHDIDAELRRMTADGPVQTGAEVAARIQANVDAGEPGGVIHVSKRAAQELALNFFADENGDLPDDLKEFFGLDESDEE